MTSKKPQYFQVGTLTVHGVSKMKPEERAQVGRWLRRVGEDIRKNGTTYAEGRFTARLSLPVVGKKK